MASKLSFLAAWLLLTPAVQAQNQILNILDQLNVITGNYSPGNETEGSAFVYGTYLPQGTVQFGFNGGAVADDRTNVLWLNNGVANSNNTTLLTGSVISRVAVNAAQFTLNGNAANNPSVNQGTSLWNAAITGFGVSSVSELTSVISAASVQWSQLTSNSTGSAPGNGSYTFNATPTSIDGHQIAVFNVAASTLFGGGTFDRLEAAFNGAETLLINVSGTTINMDKNFANGFINNESKVMFNFYEATSLTINRNFRGGIYAPLANLVQNGTNLDGTVVSASITQTAEIHDERFDSYLPFTAIPEPASPMLALLGGSLMLRRRR